MITSVMRFFLVISLSFLSACSHLSQTNKTISSPEPSSAIQLASGVWGLDPSEVTLEELDKFNCQNSAVRVEISDDASTFTSKHFGEAEESATIIQTSESFIAIEYVNEKRLMDDGRPHIWLMYFLDKDKFTWVRQDWMDASEIIQGSTPARVRCDETYAINYAAP